MGDASAASPQRLGRELASARQAFGQSLRDVASASGISPAYLQKLERGHVGEPSPKILARVATALRLDYRKLFELAGYDVPADRGQRRSPSPRFAAADLTEAEERAVAAFIDHLVAQRPKGR